MARRLAHPGPALAPRREAAPTRLVPVSGALAPGETVMAGVARLMGRAGCVGGALRLEGGGCRPFRYVLPAASTDGLHAAWYSDPRAPPGGARIVAATAIVGRREGAPFLHCHGRWETGADGDGDGGAERMGHMLPLECVVAEPIRVSGFGSATALFDAVPDPETAFTLFSPRAQAPVEDPSPGRGSRRGLLLRLRPDEDVGRAVEAAAREAGIAKGEVVGIGSVNEVVFEGGGRVSCHATEIAVEEGRVEEGRVRLDVSVVDIAGAVHRGRLLSGDNPVGVTFELLIAEDG